MMARPISGFDSPETKLFVEPFIGWRGWQWDAHRQRLVSFNSEVWNPGDELHARCIVGSYHDAPALDCNCGIFSMKDPRWLANHVPVENRQTVIGTIKIWGNIVGGSKGWRAEWAMIDALYVPCSDAEIEQAQLMKFMYDIDGDKTPAYLRSAMADAIEEVYGVTVYRHDPHDEMTMPNEWGTDVPF